MNINWKEVFSQKFWFDIDLATLHRSDYLILYIGAALALVGIGLSIYRIMVKNQFLKKVAGRIAQIFITIGLLEVLWFGLRYENTRGLGTKFTAALIFLVGLIWLYWPVKYIITRYKTDMAEAERKVMRDKYLNYNKK